MKKMLGAFQEDGDDYSGACSIQVLHCGGGSVAAQDASTLQNNELLLLAGRENMLNPFLEILEGCFFSLASLS